MSPAVPFALVVEFLVPVELAEKVQYPFLLPPGRRMIGIAYKQPV